MKKQLQVSDYNLKIEIIKIKEKIFFYLETYELVKCANEKNRAPINQCFQNYSSVIRYTADSVDDSTKVLSLLCCNYHRALGCLISDKLKDCGAINTSKYYFMRKK